MSTLVVRCPQCNKGLKLKDRSKLGKKARCPQCDNVWVLQAPSDGANDDDDEVDLQMAPAAGSSGSAAAAPGQPLEGKAARWVPDNAAAAVPQPGAASQPVAASQLGAAILPVGVDDLGGVARLKELKRKSAKRRNMSIVAGILTACVVAGVVYAANNHVAEEKKTLAEAAKPKRDEELDAKKEEMKAQTELAKAASPTSGKPISLSALPLGVRVLINVRPVELWKSPSRGEEMRFCLGPFGEWLEAKLKEICHFEPAQIEQAIIGIIPGQVGDPPKVCAVVRTVEKYSKADMLTGFGGISNDEWGHKVHIADGFCYMMLADQQTIVFAPKGDDDEAEFAREIAGSVEFANPQSEGVDALVLKSDADRHLTVIFEPRTLAVHRDFMFPGETFKLIDRFLEFFVDDDIEAVSWSMHFGDRSFFNEVQMRNQTIIREHQLLDQMKSKLKDVPFAAWKDLVKKMNPQMVGPRKVIGRFPAMLQVFAKSTIGGIDSRSVQLTTQLSERAAPNLALGAYLAWNESTRTDFNANVKPTGPAQSTEKLPELVADRLKKVIICEFTREPLQNAFAYIGDECKVQIDIDGDALKLSGYTKNMVQAFTLQDTGYEAIRRIVTKPMQEQLCIVIQEDQKRLLVTTFAVAKQQGLTPYEYK